MVACTALATAESAGQLARKVQALAAIQDTTLAEVGTWIVFDRVRCNSLALHRHYSDSGGQDPNGERGVDALATPR